MGSEMCIRDRPISIGSSGDINAASWAQNTSLGGLTLKTVNSNVGSFTNANITVNAKGLITAVSNGSSIAASASGNRWGVNGYIASDGVMEVGKYIDFHTSDGSTADHALRTVSYTHLTLPTKRIV